MLPEKTVFEQTLLKGHLRHLEDDMDWEKLTLVLKYQGGNLVHLCSFLHQLMLH